MNYTDEQYAMLERFEPGLNIDKLTEDELPIYWFLMEQKLLQPRHDIEDGLHQLTERGKQVLSYHRASLKKIEQDAEQLAQENAAEKKSKSSDRRFDVFLLFLGFVLGIIADHISEIFGFFCNLFS